MKFYQCAAAVLLALFLAAPASAEVYEITYTSTPGMTIPDDGPPVTDSVVALVSGSVMSVAVYLDVSIGWTSDLIIKLTSPAGTQKTVVFVDSGIPDPDIPGWWFPGDHDPWEDLSAFQGEGAEGVWTLTCQDHSSGSEGTLNEWRVSITYEVTPVQGSTWGDVKALYQG